MSLHMAGQFNSIFDASLSGYSLDCYLDSSYQYPSQPFPSIPASIQFCTSDPGSPSSISGSEPCLESIGRSPATSRIEKRRAQNRKSQRCFRAKKREELERVTRALLEKEAALEKLEQDFHELNTRYELLKEESSSESSSKSPFLALVALDSSAVTDSVKVPPLDFSEKAVFPDQDDMKNFLEDDTLDYFGPQHSI